MPRKTDSKNPADGLLIAASDMDMVRMAADNEISYSAAHSKLAEILEKVMKAELLQLGWELEKTHDLERLLQCLTKKKSDLVATVTPLCDALADVYFTDRYPGFDLDDPDWPKLRAQVEGMAALLETVKSRLPTSG